MIVVVMGVAGAGKTTIGRRLAAALDAEFIEGDAHHPPGNIKKMAVGRPLSDADRRPWLQALAVALDDWRRQERDVVLACSALKTAYRRLLSAGADDVCFVHLQGPIEMVQSRMEGRTAHFMPASLLASQYRDLEPPEATEVAITVDIAGTPDEVARRALAGLRTTNRRRL